MSNKTELTLEDLMILLEVPGKLELAFLERMIENTAMLPPPIYQPNEK